MSPSVTQGAVAPSNEEPVHLSQHLGAEVAAALIEPVLLCSASCSSLDEGAAVASPPEPPAWRPHVRSAWLWHGAEADQLFMSFLILFGLL